MEGIVMNILISDNLKELRKNKGNTQEDLAEFLTISINAVSKWERGECYPDIELLPKIAMYYDVSVDDLLGVGKIRIEQKIAEYREKADKYERLGEIDNVKSVWNEAFKEFPNDHHVLMNYMSWTLTDEHMDEKVKIAERLLKESDDKFTRYMTIRSICHLYARLENEEKAIEWAAKAPWADITSSHLITEIYKGENLVEAVQDNLGVYVNIIDTEIHDMTWKGGLNNSDQRKARQCCLKLFEWLYEDGDYGFMNTRMARIYADLATFDAMDKNTDGVIENLSLTADCAISFLTDKSNAKRTSFLLNRTQFEGGFQGYGGPDNACMVYLKFMKKDCFDFCREDERFKAIEEKLSEYAGKIK